MVKVTLVKCLFDNSKDSEIWVAKEIVLLAKPSIGEQIDGERIVDISQTSEPLRIIVRVSAVGAKRLAAHISSGWGEGVPVWFAERQ